MIRLNASLALASVGLITLQGNVVPVHRQDSWHLSRTEVTSVLPALTGWKDQHPFGFSEQAPEVIGNGGIELPLSKIWSVEFYCTGSGKITLTLFTGSHSSPTRFITSPCDRQINYAEGSVVHTATMLIPSAPSNVEFEVAVFVGIWSR